MSKKGKTLFVPDAPFRPGDKPDFSNLNLPEAGLQINQIFQLTLQKLEI